MIKNKIYGYAIGYRELGSRFIRYFTTFSYKGAKNTLRIYQKYPVRERKTNRPLIDAVWEIQPITKKEIMRSILDELPFLKQLTFLFYFHRFNVSRKIFHFFPSERKILFLKKLSTLPLSLGLW